jgi:hypothetical protein
MTQSLSLLQIRGELAELRKDRDSFVRAYDLIRARLDSSLTSARNYPPLHKWSGSRAVTGSLELVIVHIEKNIEEHAHAIQMIEEGQIENSDELRTAPVLGVIEGGDSE